MKNYKKLIQEINKRLKKIEIKHHSLETQKLSVGPEDEMHYEFYYHWFLNVVNLKSGEVDIACYPQHLSVDEYVKLIKDEYK